MDDSGELDWSCHIGFFAIQDSNGLPHILDRTSVELTPVPAGMLQQLSIHNNWEYRSAYISDGVLSVNLAEHFANSKQKLPLTGSPAHVALCASGAHMHLRRCI